ncbi:hypothetical protein TNCV_5046141 [Trichonephila clavipes]|uniref:Uncharacterized protein n=1 Tax=Trichonephila clavipes TaxID=2585209 RepID=A0A8X6WI21_TRICX|nr:hypothetical protein TNCV_5046141 [Trichonephila clavipes]
MSPKKNRKVINQVTSLGGQAMSLCKKRRRPGNNSLRMPSEHCGALWLSLAGTRFLFHGPQETGLTLVGGRSRSCDCSDQK